MIYSFEARAFGVFQRNSQMEKEKIWNAGHSPEINNL